MVSEPLLLFTTHVQGDYASHRYGLRRPPRSCSTQSSSVFRDQNSTKRRAGSVDGRLSGRRRSFQMKDGESALPNIPTAVISKIADAMSSHPVAAASSSPVNPRRCLEPASEKQERLARKMSDADSLYSSDDEDFDRAHAPSWAPKVARRGAPAAPCVPETAEPEILKGLPMQRSGVSDLLGDMLFGIESEAAHIESEGAHIESEGAQPGLQESVCHPQ